MRMQSNPDFDISDNTVSLDVYNQLEEEVTMLSQENRSLKVRILELQAEVTNETEKRLEVETTAQRMINSQGATADQLQMWSDKVGVLREITDLQSSLIDKEHIIRQDEVISDLREAFQHEDFLSPNYSLVSEGSIVPQNTSENFTVLDEIVYLVMVISYLKNLEPVSHIHLNLDVVKPT